MPKSASQQRGYIFMMVVVSLSLLAALALWMGSDTSMSNYTSRAQVQRDQARYAAEAGLNHARWLANASNCTSYPDLANTELDVSGLVDYSATFTTNTGSPVEIIATGKTATGGKTRLKRWLPMFSLPENGVFTASGDTYITATPANNNYGALTKAKIVSEAEGKMRGLFQFDISGLGTESTISNATLQLYINSPNLLSPLDITVYAVSTPWSQGSATWNQPTSTTYWATPGGDFSAEAYASATVNIGDSGLVSWDLTDLVRAWQAGLPNYGILLKASAATTDVVEFDTRETAAATEHPKLNITYRCECGRSCATATFCDPHLLTQEISHSATLSALGITKPYGTAYIPKGIDLNGHTDNDNGMVVIADEGQRLLILTRTDGSLIQKMSIGGAAKGYTGLTWVTSGTWENHLALIADKGRAVYVYDSSLFKKASFSIPSNFTAEGISHISKTKTGLYDDHWILVGTKRLLIGFNFSAFIFNQNMNLVDQFTLPSSIDGPEGVAHINNLDEILVLDSKNNTVVNLDLNGNELSHYSLNDYTTGSAASLAINTTSCEHITSSILDNRFFSLRRWTSCRAFFQDNFDTVSYSGSDGLTNWAPSPWIERNEGDGPAAGSLQVNGGWLVVSGSNKALYRHFDLSGNSLASLKLLSKRVDLDDAADFVTVNISSTGKGGPWTELARYSGAGTDAVAVSEEFDLSSHISNDMWLRFHSASTLGPDDAVWFDEVTIEVCPE
ncbi:DNRLRE domain-containing protein [Zhongshania sp.]|uniref:DNRLRE domain-containing protein n=1 Tax=Zhongshania sp. TaxID=1971902 RepID=UPI0035667A3C